MSNPPSFDDDSVIRVGGGSNPTSVGSVIAQAVVAGSYPKIRAIGAGAVNQASKACAIARGYVSPRGIDIAFIVGFDDVPGNDGGLISSVTWKPVRIHNS